MVIRGGHADAVQAVHSVGDEIDLISYLIHLGTGILFANFPLYSPGILPRNLVVVQLLQANNSMIN